MRKSRQKVISKYIFIFILGGGIIFSFRCYLLPVRAKYKFSKMLAGLDLRKETISISRWGFSFKDGIIFKNLSFITQGEENSVYKLAFKKSDPENSILIEDANLDFGFFCQLLSRAKNRASSLSKIRLKNIQLRLNNKNLINFKKGFIKIGDRGVNWDLVINLGHYFLKFRGYSSKSKECYFILTLPGKSSILVGRYNFIDDNLEGKFYWKKRCYILGANLGFEDNFLVLKDIRLGKFYLWGPLRLRPGEKISSLWSVKGLDFSAFGSLDFQENPDEVNIYFKIQEARRGDYKLITNFYLDYFKKAKVLKFNSLGTVLNNKPFPELSFSLQMTKGGILIENFKYQGGFTLSGYLDYNFNFSLKGKFEEFTPEELLNIFFPLYVRELNLKKVDGELSYFSYNGMELIDILLKFPKGKIGEIRFQQGNIHLIGNSQVLEFVNSELIVNDTPMLLEGRLELSKFPQPEMWEEVYLVSVVPSLPWGEIDFENKFGGRHLSLRTKLKDNVKLDYNVEFLDEENYNRNEVSLQIDGKPNLKLRLREEEEIMSFEKSIKF